MFHGGIDIGSLTAKAVVLDGDEIRASSVLKARARVEDSVRDVTAAVLEKGGVRFEEVGSWVSTGYGRERIPFACANKSEIACHARGASFLSPQIRTVVDVGGQDCKAIRLTSSGKVVDFAMNDKCAAGTGRALEQMAEALGYDIAELGPMSSGAKHPVVLTNHCSLFARTEILRLLCEETAPEDIAAGINHSLARRIAVLVRKVGIERDVCMTGGVSKNGGVQSSLAQMLGVCFIPLGADPQIVGALGAAVYAEEMGPMP